MGLNPPLVHSKYYRVTIVQLSCNNRATSVKQSCNYRVTSVQLSCNLRVTIVQPMSQCLFLISLDRFHQVKLNCLSTSLTSY